VPFLKPTGIDFKYVRTSRLLIGPLGD